MNAVERNSASEPRLVCLLAPEGADELTISRGWGSQSIIGLEQYRLMKKFSGLSSLCLYDKLAPVCEDDILLVMMCLPVVQYDTLTRFKKIIYYFDDMHPGKATKAAYAEKFEKVAAYISPLKSIYNEMNSKNVKKSFYLPWSMMDADFDIEKTETASVFIDMDERDFTAFSIERGFVFARLCLDLGLKVYAFEKFVESCPADLNGQINFVPRMAPGKFRRLLSTMWFYASGIKSSYEYSVLESAMLGCGLVSIHSAVQQEHLDRCFCLSFEEQEGFASEFVKAISCFDKSKIISDARRLYPQNSSVALRQILSEVFSL